MARAAQAQAPKQGPYCLLRFCVEQTLTINTAAAGGNMTCWPARAWAAEGVEAKRVGKESSLRPVLRTVVPTTAGKWARSETLSNRCSRSASAARQAQEPVQTAAPCAGVMHRFLSKVLLGPRFAHCTMVGHLFDRGMMTSSPYWYIEPTPVPHRSHLLFAQPALLARGKVRDNYAVGDERILMWASDRVSV